MIVIVLLIIPTTHFNPTTLLVVTVTTVSPTNHYHPKKNEYHSHKVHTSPFLHHSFFFYYCLTRTEVIKEHTATNQTLLALQSEMTNQRVFMTSEREAEKVKGQHLLEAEKNKW